MLEQKLFFTRNGEFTLWEKISKNNKSNLTNIKNEIENIFGFSLGDEEGVITNNIYILYNRETRENKLIIEEIVDRNFSWEDKSDFNALLYKFDSDNLDINIIDSKLNQLSQRLEEYEDKELEVSKFIDIDSKVIDVRLKSIKSLYYKGSSNEQILNTEIRIYLNWGIIVMTDFSDYTHKKSTKNKIISDISDIILGSRFKIRECILTDMTLRVLLKQSNNNASKFKFSIEGLMDVDFNIVDGSSGDPLKYEHVNSFYEKYKLSLIKISMSENSEKYITVDGNKGKLHSRSKNLDSKDIDEFMNCLNEVMKYDYLNKDYRDQVFEKTKNKLIMPTISKKALIEDLYKDIYESISLELGKDFTIDRKSILTNAFFYCLLNGVIIRGTNRENLVISKSISKLIIKLFEVDEDSINKLYSDLIFIGENTENDILEEIDRYIMYEGVENVS